jgi:hypothetical protein
MVLESTESTYKFVGAQLSKMASNKTSFFRMIENGRNTRVYASMIFVQQDPMLANLMRKASAALALSLRQNPPSCAARYFLFTYSFGSWPIKYREKTVHSISKALESNIGPVSE